MQQFTIEGKQRLRIFPFDDNDDGMIEIKEARISLPYAYSLGYIRIEDVEDIVCALNEAIRLAKEMRGGNE